MTTIHTEPGFKWPGVGHSLVQSLARQWWLLFLRGLVSIAFGVSTFIWPSLTVLAVVLVWAAYVFVDGVLALGAAVFGRHDGVAQRWWLALAGVIGIAAGVLTFLAPWGAARAFLVFIG